MLNSIASPSPLSTSVLLSQFVSPFSSLFLLLPYKRQLPGQEAGGVEKAAVCFWECFDIRPAIPPVRKAGCCSCHVQETSLSVFCGQNQGQSESSSVSWCHSWTLNTCLLNWLVTIPRLSPEAAELIPRKKEAEARSHKLRERLENWYRNPQFLATEVPLRHFQLLLICSLLRLGSWASLSQTLKGKGKRVGGSCEVSISVCPRHLEPNPTGYGEVLYILCYSSKAE